MGRWLACSLNDHEQLALIHIHRLGLHPDMSSAHKSSKKGRTYVVKLLFAFQHHPINLPLHCSFSCTFSQLCLHLINLKTEFLWGQSSSTKPTTSHSWHHLLSFLFLFLFFFFFHLHPPVQSFPLHGVLVLGGFLIFVEKAFAFFFFFLFQYHNVYSAWNEMKCNDLLHAYLSLQQCSLKNPIIAIWANIIINCNDFADWNWGTLLKWLRDCNHLNHLNWPFKVCWCILEKLAYIYRYSGFFNWSKILHVLFRLMVYGAGVTSIQKIHQLVQYWAGSEYFGSTTILGKR